MDTFKRRHLVAAGLVAANFPVVIAAAIMVREAVVGPLGEASSNE